MGGAESWKLRLARKWNGIRAWFRHEPEKQLCDCGAEIAQEATKCAKCGTEEGRRCVVCAKRIPFQALRCNECDAYQGRLRRYFPFSSTAIALLTAFFAVLSTLFSVASGYLNRHSDTSFTVAGADEEYIYVRVWNTGRRSSMLTQYRLVFNDLDIIPAFLDLGDDDKKEAKNITPSETPSLVRLSIGELALFRPNHGSRYSKREIEQLLRVPLKLQRPPVTLEMKIEESGHAWQVFNPEPFISTRTDTFPVSRVHAFILGRMSDVR